MIQPSETPDRNPEHAAGSGIPGHGDTPRNQDIESAGESFYNLILAAQNLGLRTEPSEDEPYRVINHGSVKDLPKRVFHLVSAIEALGRSDVGEINQILDGAMTILNLKVALYSILGWIAANGLADRHVASIVTRAMQASRAKEGSDNSGGGSGGMSVVQILRHTAPGPSAPKGSAGKMQSQRDNIANFMVAPTIAPQM